MLVGMSLKILIYHCNINNTYADQDTLFRNLLPPQRINVVNEVHPQYDAEQAL